MDLDDSHDDEGPLFAWLPPEDRLWRHPSEVASPPPPPPLRRTSALSHTWAVALVAGIVGALLASGVGVAAGAFGRPTVVEPVATPTPNTLASALSDQQHPSADWPAIADALAPSMVSVAVSTPSGGVVVSGILWAAGHSRSYVLTSADALGGATRCRVTFDDGTTAPAGLVGVDPGTGVGLLWVAGEHRSVASLGSVADVSVADPVLAVGYRDSDGPSVSPGAVGGMDEQVTTAGGSTFEGMIAVSGATVAAAADGGALVDANGAVVGIATDLSSVAPDQQGSAYAVPIDVADRAALSLLHHQPPPDAWIGVQAATDLSPATARQMGIHGGVQVGAVAPGSPAASVGLAAGDVVTSFGGHAVDSSGALVHLLAEASPNQRVSVGYLADGHQHSGILRISREPAVLPGR